MNCASDELRATCPPDITHLTTDHSLHHALLSFVPKFDAMQGYVPGEQPRAGKFIKLNTNENPYPSSPAVQRAIGACHSSGACKNIPIRWPTAFRTRAAELLGVEPDWILCGNGSDDIADDRHAGLRRPRATAAAAVSQLHPLQDAGRIQGAEAKEVHFQRDWSLGDDFRTPPPRLKLAFFAESEQPVGHDDSACARFCELAAAPCPARWWWTKRTSISPKPIAWRW